jgi:hypothetical protein
MRGKVLLFFKIDSEQIKKELDRDITIAKRKIYVG